MDLPAKVAQLEAVVAANSAAVAANSAAVAANSAAVAELAKAERKRELDALLIRPTYSVSTGSGVRSPKSMQERLALKVAVIDFYELWASEEDNKYNRRVYPMLQPEGKRDGLPFNDVHLAHIWPSSKAPEAKGMRRVFNLPEDFHLNERNFLILEDAVEAAFDNEALLLLPRRAEAEAPAQVVSRALWLERLEKYDPAKKGAAAVEARTRLMPYFGQPLFLPKADEGKMPFLRLLAWHAISALAARSASDDDRVSELPDSIHADATITMMARGRSVEAFTELASVGLLFGLPRE